MQFFALILINIAMFAIFYLLISLKLERKATEFREKKLRRLMEEMIADFNETAERNITLLENRINTMKKMMQSPGGVRTFDVSVMGGDDGPDGNAPAGEVKARPGAHDRAGYAPVNAGRENSPGGLSLAKAGEALTKGAGLLARSLRDLLAKAPDREGTNGIPARSEREETALNGDTRGRSGASKGPDSLEAPHGLKPEALIQKDFSSLGSTGEKEPKADDPAGEEEIMCLFKEAGGKKYALVGDLYGKGYSIELISRCSGIPQGEIRLVLNLGI